MIDLHNHILVGVDDGPQSEVEMVELVTQASAQGITGIVATPHHLHPRYDNEAHQVLEKLDNVKNHPAIKELEISIYPGQEIRLSADIPKGLETGAIIGLNQSKYLLIEFPSNEVPHYTKPLFFQLLQNGYTPIIAHPERNKAMIKDPKLLYELVQNGALSQLTAGSLLGAFGKKVSRFAQTILSCQLAHLIASDAHSTEKRPFQLQTLLEDSNLRPHKEKLQRLINNGEDIIHNNNIKLQQPLSPTKNKKFFGLI